VVYLVTFALAAATPFEAQIAAAVRDVEEVFHVPPALVKAVIEQESGFDPRARSGAGAIGLMQVMPFNAEKVGLRVEDLWVPAKNILAGVRLLAVLLRHYQGDVISALAAYNARPRQLFAPLPQNGETPRYVLSVLHLFESYSSGRPPFEVRRAPLAEPHLAQTKGAVR
jgi:soluble lytic murein transglycosylase-like protein